MKYKFLIAQLSCLWTSVIVGTKLMAPPVTIIVGLVPSALDAALLISSDVTASMASQYLWKVKSPIVEKFLAISSSLSSCFSSERRMFIFKTFLALTSSSSEIFSLSLLISSSKTDKISYEWEPAPSMEKPRRPESEKWLFSEDTPSMKLYFFVSPKALFLPTPPIA